jgi:acetylornithine/succinyldiaminopimelate/putrescine aminotransferase
MNTTLLDDPNAALVQEEDAHGFPVYGERPLALVRGEGCHLFDAQGERYLDFYGGHAVASLGYGHPAVVAALTAQVERLSFVTNAFASDVRAAYMTALAQTSGLPRVFLVNSGAEANENALKLALKATGRTRVIAMTGAFHGRTAAAAAVTDQHGKPFPYPQPPLPVTFVPVNDGDALASAMAEDVAAVILEPILSLGGVHVATREYLALTRELCDRHGAVLIFDEVQTGFGRLGSLFAAHHFGVMPDIITCAKGIAAGLPMAATLAAEPLVSSLGEGALGTTFGGGPLVCAAALAVLETVRQDAFLANVRSVSATLIDACRRIPGILEVRGQGLLIGLRSQMKARAWRDSLLRHRVLVGTSADPSIIRLLPPLTITQDDVAEFVRTVPRTIVSDSRAG